MPESPSLDVALMRYARLLLIRRAEERIRLEYPRDEMKTPVHLGIGAEAIAVGLCDAAPEGTSMFGTYRNHALYLARTGDLDGFFGELYGRVTGGARGKAGSMHLSSPAQGLLATSAVVGTTIPVAVGAALAHRYRGLTAPSVGCLGDGAIEEGVFWESLNFACLKQLPVVFVCEDNGLAIHTTAAARQGFTSVTAAVSAFRCLVSDASGVDVHQVATIAAQAFAHVATMQRPAFLRFRWHRALGHVGIHEDYADGYRDAPSEAERQASDPLALCEAGLRARGVTAETLVEYDAGVTARIDAAVDRARSAPLPGADDLTTDVWA